MKHLRINFICLLLFFFSFNTVNAQSPLSGDQKKLLDQIKKKMDETELGLLAESDISFGEAKAILENVSAEDVEVEQLFTKGSTPKSEKKAVNVKRNRIEAAKLYEKGYNMVFEACESRLKQMKFPEEPKQTKAKELSSAASETMTNAVTKGDDYKYLKDKDLETLRYDDLKSRIEGANKLFLDGLAQEFDAWKLYFGEFSAELEAKKDSVATIDTTKKEVVVQPETAAQVQQENSPKVPTSIETTLPTQNPIVTQNLTSSPKVSNGVLTEKDKELITEKVSEPVKPLEQPKVSQPAKQQPAKQPVAQNKKSKNVKMTSVEPKESNTQETSSASNISTVKSSKKGSGKSNNSSLESSSNLKGTVYLVQLLAIQRGKLSETAKKELYSGSKKMFEDYEEDLYKYRIGDFASEEEAIKFKQEYGKGSFVLKFIDGKRQTDYINK